MKTNELKRLAKDISQYANIRSKFIEESIVYNEIITQSSDSVNNLYIRRNNYVDKEEKSFHRIILRSGINFLNGTKLLLKPINELIDDVDLKLAPLFYKFIYHHVNHVNKDQPLSISLESSLKTLSKLCDFEEFHYFKESHEYLIEISNDICCDKFIKYLYLSKNNNSDQHSAINKFSKNENYHINSMRSKISNSITRSFAFVEANLQMLPNADYKNTAYEFLKTEFFLSNSEVDQYKNKAIHYVNRYGLNLIKWKEPQDDRIGILLTALMTGIDFREFLGQDNPGEDPDI